MVLCLKEIIPHFDILTHVQLNVYVCTEYKCLFCENMVYAVLSENYVCFFGKQFFLKFFQCKVCDQLKVCAMPRMYFLHGQSHRLRL